MQQGDFIVAEGLYRSALSYIKRVRKRRALRHVTTHLAAGACED